MASQKPVVTDTAPPVDVFDPKYDKFVTVGKCNSTGKEVTLCYRTFGDSSRPCLLMMQGLKATLLTIPPELGNYIADHGYYVVVYDNRDCGRSTYFEECDVSPIVRYRLPRWLPFPEVVPYTLEDMAEDGARLLTALNIEKAHVFGMSMGGMTAQLLAIRYPERVLSLSILFSHVGGEDMVHPSLFSYLHMLETPDETDAQAIAESQVRLLRYLGAGNYRDEYDTLLIGVKKVAARNTCNSAKSRVRQVAALMTAPSRLHDLASVRCPTLIMHGCLDPLIPVANGQILASTIPNAKLVLYPKLGHDFPPALHRDFADQILLNMRAVDEDSAAASKDTLTSVRAEGGSSEAQLLSPLYTVDYIVRRSFGLLTLPWRGVYDHGDAEAAPQSCRRNELRSRSTMSDPYGGIPHREDEDPVPPPRPRADNGNDLYATHMSFTDVVLDTQSLGATAPPARDTNVRRWARRVMNFAVPGAQPAPQQRGGGNAGDVVAQEPQTKKEEKRTAK